jgi:hypothetical protein
LELLAFGGYKVFNKEELGGEFDITTGVLSTNVEGDAWWEIEECLIPEATNSLLISRLKIAFSCSNYCIFLVILSSKQRS